MLFVRHNVGDVAKVFRPIGGPWYFFNRFRISAGCVLLEVIMDYNRIREIICLLGSVYDID